MAARASRATRAGGRCRQFASQDGPQCSAAVASISSPAAVLLRALLPRLVAIAVLAVGFQVLTIAVSLGWLDMADHDVEQALASAWDPPLHPVFQAIALLGGIEVTTILLVAL